ncbi:MAG: hypothetical protein QXR03_03630, partial [Candidatus Aenigmatarchaeota archaeon]
KSKCVNDESEDEGIIYIDNKGYSLQYSIELLKNRIYQIEYEPNEGYEFDHWEIYGGKLNRPQNSSRNYVIIQNDYGEIIAFYRKIGAVTTTTTSSTLILTTSTSTTSLRTTTASSSFIRITTTTQTSTLRTTSIGTTSTRTEIKTTSSSTLTTSSIKKEENLVDSYIITPIKEYIINPIIKYIIEPINEYIIKPFIKYIVEPILKYIIQPFIEYIIKPIIEIIIKIIEIIKNIIKIILDIFGWIINTITGQSKETYTTSQIYTSYSTKYKTYEKTKSIEEKSTYKENLISYEKISKSSTKFIISYETKINTIYITKTIKTIGNKEIITTYPIITTIYESPYIITTTITSNTITSYKTSSSSSISTTIPKKITTIYEKTSTIKNTEEPITTYKQVTNTITSSSLTSSTTSTKSTSSINTKTSIKSETPKQTTVTSTSSKITTSSTTYSFKTETIYYTITGFTTTYKTALYTYTTTVKKTTSSSSKISGGGGGGREGPLLRDSILSNKNVYKEFLRKIGKKEENRKLPLLYLVYKITPLRVEQNRYYKDMIVYKIRPIIKNYDNENRKCIISIGEIGGKPNGLFLIKPNVDSIYEGFNVYSLFHEINKEKLIKYGFEVSNEVIIDIKANEKFDNYLKIFFLEEENLPSFLGENYHTLNLYLYVYYNGKLRPIDAEPNFQSGVRLSQFGETILSFMTGVSSAINSFASASILFFFQKIFPPTVIYYVTAGTQLWSDYFAYKRIPQEEILNEAKSEAIIKSYELIDVFSKNKEVAKKEITDYVYGFLMSIENIIDPINLGAGIVTGDLRNTLPGYIFSLLEDSFNPNLETRTRAAKFGEFIGITAAFCYTFKLHEKIPKKLSELLEGKEGIIEKQLNYIWVKNNKIASEALKLLDKISEKFEDVNDEALRTIKNIKLLLNNKIKIEDIISDIENAINKIDNIRSKKELLELTNDMVYNRLKAVLMTFVGKEYDVHLKVDLFEKAGGKIFEKTSWVLFEAFTEDGELIKFIRKIGNPDSAGRLQFGGKAIYEKVGTNELYVRVAKMIVEPEDFYEIFKENVGKINIRDTIIELTSSNEININAKGNIKTINLEEIELHWNNAEGALGIRGKIKSGYGETKIGIYYDGGLNEEGTYMEVVLDAGRKIHDVELDENDVLKLLYVHGEKEEIHRIFIGEVPTVKLKVSSNKIEYCLVNEKSWRDWFGAGEDNKAKGNIAELWAREILKILFGNKYEVRETAGGTKNSRIADLDILIRESGESIPGSVKSFKYRSGMSEWSIKKLFNDKLNDIIETFCESDFLKEKYKDSEYGIAIIIGLSEDEGCCDVLIAKVYSDGTHDILYKPSWW